MEVVDVLANEQSVYERVFMWRRARRLARLEAVEGVACPLRRTHEFNKLVR